MSFKEKLGILRSFLMYYAKPFGHRRLLRFYAPYIEEGDLCFDIGAHLGNRSRAFRALGARVIAVEPQPVCIRFLEKKFEEDVDFILEKKAIGEANRTMTMHVSSLTPTVSTLTDKDWRDFLDNSSRQSVKWDQQVEVEMTTLDDLIQEYGLPVFCKIDIENYELNALKGLSHPIPVISFEFFTNRMDTAIACLSRIEQIGDYVFNISAGESQKLFFPHWLNARDLKEQLIAGNHFMVASGDIYARQKSLLSSDNVV